MTLTIARPSSPVIRRPLPMTRRALIAGAAAGPRRCWRRAAPRADPLDVTQGTVKPMPIALPDFLGGGPADGEVGAQRHAGDHRESQALRPVRADRSGGLHRAHRQLRQVPRFPDWRTINAQALVTGRITRQSDGRLKTEFRLWDVSPAEQLTGQQYFTAADNWRQQDH